MGVMGMMMSRAGMKDKGMATEGDNWGERYNYGHARAKTCMDERPRTWCKEIRVEKTR